MKNICLLTLVNFEFFIRPIYIVRGPGHELHPSAIKFVPTLRKLSDEIMEEIRFLTVVAKADEYQIIRKKFKIRIHRPDLYNAISKFRHESIPGEADAGILLKRFHKKKIEDS
ncbi:hypothetical protein RirG_149980 [Rhizophagus irregularis DAOM 197198w]|uniref:Uncharacterized protein n=1 Tax=Rhizophagus irregularis (strain DAOM 197198w) TaxID=1432141 RepID=A0A015J9Z0_RHIIW|nr:hypothetical protein RirG_149980 [Rhizophagus irregularis DAOM 197198w]